MSVSVGVFDGHNASAVLAVDGKVVRAVQEERLSRTKNHYGPPEQAVAAVLQLEGVDPRDVDRIDLGSRYVRTPRHPREMKIAFDERYRSADEA